MKKFASMFCAVVLFAGLMLSVRAEGSIYAKTAFVGKTQVEANETFSLNLLLTITEPDVFGSLDSKQDGMYFKLNYDRSKLAMSKIEGINGWSIKETENGTRFECSTQTAGTRSSVEICKITFKALEISTSVVKLISATAEGMDYTEAFWGWVNVCETSVTVTKAKETPSSTPSSSSVPESSSSAPESSAQSGKVSDVETATGAKLSAEEGVLPAGTKIALETITTGTDFDIAKNAFGDTASKLEVYDISLKCDGADVAPNGKVKISVPVPQGFDADKLKFFSVAKDGTKTELEITVADNEISFETDKMSTFAVVELSSETSETASTEETSGETPNKLSTGWKIAIVAFVVLAGGALCVFLFMKKKSA